MYRLRLILALLLLALLAPAVSANGMPVGAWLGTPGGVLLPTGGPAVKVHSEELRFVIAGQTAVVSALYQLENQGGPTAGQVAFAVPSGATEILVALNGKAVPVPMNLTDGNKLGVADVDRLTARPVEWLNPFSGKPFVAKLWRKEPGVYWQSFQLDLQPGLQDLLVTYRSAAGQDNSQLLLPMQRFDYLLAPASRWAGFGDLSIKIETTEPSSLAANLPFTQVDDRHWEAHLTALPAQNLAFFIGPSGNGFLGLLWWGKTGRLGLLIGSALLLGLAAGLIRRGGKLIRLPIALLPLLLIHRGIFEPNPIGNVAYMASFAVAPLLYVLCWWLAARVRR
ncbi:MAG TPA: hypothetical protein VK191_05055 [Symbiobacteriaceae bacterium]|nr:hypothetical protein [Symbiobacteriaceae bacterium]